VNVIREWFHAIWSMGTESLMNTIGTQPVHFPLRPERILGFHMLLVLTPVAAIVLLFYTQDKLVREGSRSRLCRSHLLGSRQVKITVTPTAAILFLIWYILKADGIL